MFAIGEVSRLSGVNIETIRYYEREGVLPSPERSGSGRRMYSQDGLARIRFVKRSRDLGFSIAETRELLDLTAQAGQTCAQVKPIAQSHRDAVDEKIRQLRSMRKALDDLIQECGRDQGECPILDMLMSD